MTARRLAILSTTALRALIPAAASIAIALAAGCSRKGGERLPVRIDLAQYPAVAVGGRVAPLVRHSAGGHPALVLEAGQAKAFYVALPRASTLRFALESGRAATEVGIEVADDRERFSIDTREIAPGEFEADLSRIAPGPTELRFESTTGSPITLVSPRVEGMTTARPAPIEAGEIAERRPYNVVLYVVDTLRADRLSAYGYDRPTSPEIERLAERGLLFENAYAPSSHTMPSISALFGSRMPAELQGRLLAEEPAATTLAESFRRGGYRTAAFQTNFVVLDTLGFDRGFESYTQLRHESGGRLELYDAAELHDELEVWLAHVPAEPFFLYVQSMDVHFPYDAPAPYGRMFTNDEHVALPDNDFVRGLTAERRREVQTFADAWNPDLYDGGVAYADHYLGALVRLLAERGLADRTIVAITADHGEPLGDRGEFRHGYSLHEELVRVPLLLLLPGARSGRRVDQIVSLLDLAPTLLDLTGQPIPDSFTGTSMIANASEATPRTAAGEQLMIPDQTTEGWYVRRGRWKLILDRESRRTLYDVAADPTETDDLAASHPATVGLLSSLLIGRSAALRGEVVAKPLVSGDGSSDLERALRALGYVE